MSYSDDDDRQCSGVFSTCNIQHQLYSDGSISVSELLEWFRYTVKVTGFLHQSLRFLYRQSVVCQQEVFSSLFVMSVHPSQCLCVTLPSTRGSACNKLCSHSHCSALACRGRVDPICLLLQSMEGTGHMDGGERGRRRQRGRGEPLVSAAQKTG